jgi:hypothetical protein
MSMICINPGRNFLPVQAAPDSPQARTLLTVSSQLSCDDGPCAADSLQKYSCQAISSSLLPKRSTVLRTGHTSIYCLQGVNCSL